MFFLTTHCVFFGDNRQKNFRTAWNRKKTYTAALSTHTQIYDGTTMSTDGQSSSTHNATLLDSTTTTTHTLSRRITLEKSFVDTTFSHYSAQYAIIRFNQYSILTYIRKSPISIHSQYGVNITTKIVSKYCL